MRRIHFVYTVPGRQSLPGRIFDKCIKISHLPPLYRNGSDAFIPWKKPIRAPHAISYQLLHALKAVALVKFYSLYEHGIADMRDGDIFIGQPVPDGGFNYSRPDHDDMRSITSRTVREYVRNQRIIIMPYAHDELLVSWAKELISRADSVVFIGGKIWERDWEAKSPFRDVHFKKRVHVEMGIDPKEYPVVKTRFNPKGRRKYLYIGHTAWYKNTAQLEAIARDLPGFEGAHIGAGDIRGWKKIADFADLTPTYMSELAQEYDIFVTTSTADAQATTILEQMCFGMAVACTPETGYEYDSITPLSVHDTAYNVHVLSELQYLDEAVLLERARENLRLAQKNHSWKQFCEKTLSAIDL